LLKIELVPYKAQILVTRNMKCSTIDQTNGFANAGYPKASSRTKQVSIGVFAEKAMRVVFDEGGPRLQAILTKGC
jgi:hypothetical protein